MLRVSLAAFILSVGLLLVNSNAAWAASSDSASAAAPNAAPAAPHEPGWLGVVIARGELKQWIDSTPIVDRPNRPFHFYGNTVRRKYYRGNPLPQPNDVVKGGAALVEKRK